MLQGTCVKKPFSLSSSYITEPWKIIYHRCDNSSSSTIHLLIGKYCILKTYAQELRPRQGNSQEATASLQPEVGETSMSASDDRYVKDLAKRFLKK
jgi:hypothetical protein